MFRAAVVGHGDFAAGLVSAVREICGLDDVFVPLSNQSYPADELEERLREIVRSGVDVIFVDLPAGSAAVASRRVLRELPQLVIVTGTNLAVLLEFALHPRDRAGETARIAAAKGQSAIVALPSVE